MKICDNCLEFLENKKEYVPLVCWECGTIIDIFYRKKGVDTDIFSMGCRECSEKEDEKETFMVKNKT